MMPYVTQDQRDIIDPALEAVVSKVMKASELGSGLGKETRQGPLNYTITRLLLNVLDIDADHVRSHDMDRFKGILSNVADEFYRRLGGPYEDLALIKNGDIPEYQKLKEKSDAKTDSSR